MVLVEVARNDQEIFSDQTNIKKEISGNEKTEFSRTAPATRYDSTSEANSSTSGSEGEASPNRLRCRSVSPKREDTIINTTKAIYANSDSLSPSFEEEDEEAMAEMLAELGEEDVEMEEDLDESELLAAEYEAAQMEEEEMEAARNLLDMSKVIDGEEYKNLDGSINLEKKHLCDICGKGFPYLSILESHRRCHTGEKPFQCHFCDKKFAQKATLQVHERTHTGERPYKCKYCEKTFAQYGTKTVHEKSAHLGIRNYKCPKCDKCLSSPSALYTHKKTHGEKTFQCILCPKTFTLKNYLKLHVKQVHEQNERKHICHFCKKSFAYAGSLQVHVRTHTGERPYVCKYCPKAFASQGNLQSHERTHTGERPYSCTTCGRSFIQKSQLTAHEATHAYATIQHSPVHISSNASTVSTRSSNVSSPTSSILKSTSLAGSDSSTISSGISNITCDSQNLAKRSTDYVCKFCGKHYAYASSLYVHTRLHTGERPFHCNFCEKTFTNQGNMQVHQRVHTGEKPYKCESCNKSYAQKVGLKIHMEQCQGISGDSSSEKTQKNVVGNGGNCSSSSSVSFSPSSQNKLSPLPKSLAEHGLIQQQQMNMQLLSPHLSNNLNLQLANNNADADDLQLKHATEVMLSCLKSSNPSTAAAAFVALQQLQQPQSQVLRTAIPATSSSTHKFLISHWHKLYYVINNNKNNKDKFNYYYLNIPVNLLIRSASNKINNIKLHQLTCINYPMD
uniref:Zinc finger protein n=1 Tax=Rhabditophanes sp. KR3021 TaxID=114890 RepID=A0AC35U6E2_9BILA